MGELKFKGNHWVMIIDERKYRIVDKYVEIIKRHQDKLLKEVEHE